MRESVHFTPNFFIPYLSPLFLYTTPFFLLNSLSFSLLPSPYFPSLAFPFHSFYWILSHFPSSLYNVFLLSIFHTTSTFFLLRDFPPNLSLSKFPPKYLVYFPFCPLSRSPFFRSILSHFPFFPSPDFFLLSLFPLFKAFYSILWHFPSPFYCTAFPS